MRSLLCSLIAAAGLVACGSSARKDAPAADPKAPATDPAVISVPLNLPRLDTNVPDTTKKSNLIPADERERMRATSVLYALATATMINQDGRMLSQVYTPNVVLHAPDSTVRGAAEVVRYLITYARSKSLAEFQRTSHGMRILDDSTLADSGSYLMVLKRSPKDSVIERGQYASTLRARQDINAWVILEDQFKPGGPAKRKGTK
jgi:hypothetical protein